MIRSFCALCLGLLAGSAVAEPQVYVWQQPGLRFGGLSGIEVSDDGQSLTVLSDKGVVFAGQILRESGRITHVTLGPAIPLLNLSGAVVQPGQSDSEGLATDAAGGFWVSFEGPARVWHYDSPTATPTSLPDGPGFAAMANNAALEGLAVGPDGTLFTLPERSGRSSWPFPVSRYGAGGWTSAFEIPRRGRFLAVGADVGPDGRLYVLERDNLGLSFRSRVRRFGLDGSGEQTVFESGFGDFDNLEGIAVWRGPNGLRVTMVSDDNFLILQQTQLVEIDLPD